MESENTYYIDLIARYFSGELNAEEIEILRGLVLLSPESKKLFEDHSRAWQLIEHESISKLLDVEAEWIRFRASVKEKSNAEIEDDLINKTPVKNLTFARYARIAAIFIIVVLSAVWFITRLNKTEEKVITASNEIIESTLPDGSHITLKQGSTITYPTKFKEKKRMITLQGEAYFEVKHDDSHPFLIRTGNVCIEVLGTSFYVNTRNSSGNVEVVLNSGKVALYYADRTDEKVILDTGEKTEMARTGPLPAKSLNTDMNYLAWKTKKIVFTDEPLSQIVGLLNKVYGSQITIDKSSISDLRMTATFDNQDLRSVLNVIEATLDVDINKKGDNFVISERRK